MKAPTLISLLAATALTLSADSALAQNADQWASWSSVVSMAGATGVTTLCQRVMPSSTPTVLAYATTTKMMAAVATSTVGFTRTAKTLVKTTVESTETSETSTSLYPTTTSIWVTDTEYVTEYYPVTSTFTSFYPTTTYVDDTDQTVTEYGTQTITETSTIITSTTNMKRAQPTRASAKKRTTPVAHKWNDAYIWAPLVLQNVTDNPDTLTAADILAALTEQAGNVTITDTSSNNYTTIASNDTSVAYNSTTNGTSSISKRSTASAQKSFNALYQAASSFVLAQCQAASVTPLVGPPVTSTVVSTVTRTSTVVVPKYWTTTSTPLSTQTMTTVLTSTIIEPSPVWVTENPTTTETATSTEASTTVEEDDEPTALATITIGPATSTIYTATATATVTEYDAPLDTACATVSWASYAGTDYPGDDLIENDDGTDYFLQDTQDDCLTLCERFTGCVAAVYVSDTQQCYMKSDYTNWNNYGPPEDGDYSVGTFLLNHNCDYSDDAAAQLQYGEDDDNTSLSCTVYTQTSGDCDTGSTDPQSDPDGQYCYTFTCPDAPDGTPPLDRIWWQSAVVQCDYGSWDSYWWWCGYEEQTGQSIGGNGACTSQATGSACYDQEVLGWTPRSANAGDLYW